MQFEILFQVFFCIFFMLNFENVFSEELLHGSYVPGDRLPSESMLGERYGFSRPTVHRGLDALIAQGVLSRVGRSVFVTPDALRHLSSKATQGKVTFILAQESYENILFYRMMEILVERLRQSYSIEMFVVEVESSNVVNMVDPESVVVLFGRFLADGILRQLHAKCRNIFLVNDVTKYGNWLMPDNYEAGRKIAKCLYDHGHRRIGVLLHTSAIVEFEERFRGIREYLAEHDVTVKRMQLPLNNFNRYLPGIFFEEYVLSHSITALVCLHHRTALDIYDLAQENEVEIPGELSVVGFDDTTGTEFLRPALTAARYPVAAITEKLALAIPNAFQYEKGKTFLKERVPIMLMERDSVGEEQEE